MGIYLDHQATTPMLQEVKDAYVEALDVVGNPSSIHQRGQRTRGLLEGARETIAEILGCEPVEVILTSGGTEATNQVLKGSVWASRASGNTSPVIAATKGEHHATTDTLNWLVTNNHASWLEIPLDSLGVMDTASLEEKLEQQPVGSPPVLLTTLLANNEVGSLQPLDTIQSIAAHYGVPVHVDAIAALGYEPVNFASLQIQAMTVSAHKVGGPLGVGALVVSRNAPVWDALHHGGNQQRLRSGTLDAPGAIAFATALRIREHQRQKGAEALRGLRDRLRDGLMSVAPDCVLRGHPDHRLPGNLHITVPGCDGDVLLYLLDERGIQVSTGSACQAGVPEASHVLLAMGVPPESARGALRFSLSYSTTPEEVDAVVAVFAEVVARAKAAGLS
jgi:cysteine desulfurase